MNEIVKPFYLVKTKLDKMAFTITNKHVRSS